MNERELIIEILEKYFPDECDLAGPTNLQKIAEGNADFVRAEYGSNLDTTQVLAILASVAGFLNSTFSIYKNWGTGKPPDKAELKDAVEATVKIPPEISAEDLEKIYVYILHRLETDSASTAPPHSSEKTDVSGGDA